MENLSKAIIEVMKAVRGLEKNSKVGSGKNAYDGTKDSDVKKAFNSAMADHGLCILPIKIEEDVRIERWEEVDPWSKETPKPMKQKQSVFTTVKGTYLLLHTSGESIEVQGIGHGVDPQDKSAGKATTYALKNCLLYTFLTPVGAIDDTDSTHSQDIDTPKVEKPAKTWMNQKQYDGLIMLTDVEKIKANRDYFSSSTHGMKNEYKKGIEKRIEELKG